MSEKKVSYAIQHVGFDGKSWFQDETWSTKKDAILRLNYYRKAVPTCQYRIEKRILKTKVLDL